MYDIYYVSDQKTEYFYKLKQTFPLIKYAASFQEAQDRCLTEFFWVIWNDLIVEESFQFDYVPDNWSKNYVHVFKNGLYFDGICLFNKHNLVNKNEIEYRFFLNKKEIDIVASRPAFYDIVFISYQEPNADNNYTKLVEKFPNAKRIHGVKGIHQAHVAAAKLCNTEMFWVVDGDAIVLDTFKFEHQIARYDVDGRNTAYVWRSQNPINDLIYGYGGVKLLPRNLTLNMDTTKLDMTTSISNRFKVVEQISNITAFNTDPFNTWKSAFRECVKLSSKIIDRQEDDETMERLFMWKLVGKSKPYGEYSIAGAKAGEEYGVNHRDDLSALAKINDFDWLYNLFKEKFE